MAIQRRLALLMLIAGSLLCIYILCGNLERPMTWSVAPLKPLQGLKQGFTSISPDTLESEDVMSNSDPQAPTPHPTAPLEAILRGNAPPSKTPTHTVAPHKPADVPDESRTSISGLKLQERPPHPAAGPTEPPFIGDIYMTEDDPPQTNCPDSLQNQLTKTGFNERFLRNIPVVQWAKHVTPEQHLRLSRYPGAHGWGGVTYQTLLETLSVLNSSANSQLLDDWEDRSSGSECIRCAVVGNGGILKDSKKGMEIDGHDYVFRTNGAIIQGFERDVGSRTTHYTFSTNTLMNSMRSYAGVGYRGPPVSKETRYVFLPDHDRDYLLMKAAATHTLVERGPELGKTPSKYFGEDVTPEKLKMYHPDFIRYLRNRFLRSNTLKTKYKDIYRPSTGAVMLLAALHTCDQVDAYGFMTPDYKNYSDHYYDSIYHPVGFFINHDLRMEMTLWQQLHKEGLIRLYMHL